MNDFLKRAVATLPSVENDAVPSGEHQERVCRVAGELLRCIDGLAGGESPKEELEAAFEEHPLLGLEVYDEAFVVHKNRRGLWGNLSAQQDDPVCFELASRYERFSSIVDCLRDGRQRRSTTPTLKGGARRESGDGSDGAPSYFPLIFALKDLRIRYFMSKLSAPREFSRNTCLVRGETVLPTASDATRRKWLERIQPDPLPVDPMEPLLRKSLGRWPEDALVAVRGITAFGPGDDDLARRCAVHALRLNPDCLLAQQLLELATRAEDPRVPFTNAENETGIVLKQLGGRAPSAKTRPRPWWKFWQLRG